MTNQIKLLIITAVLLLTGCYASVGTPKNDITVPKQLLEACGPLKKLKDNPLPSDVLEAKKSDVLDYETCAQKQKRLSEIVQKIIEQSK